MPEYDSFIDDKDERGLTIVVDMKRFKIDVAAKEILVEELVASLRRAGIERIECSRTMGNNTADNGWEERLIYRAILPAE